jgi:hypothetical protein
VKRSISVLFSSLLLVGFIACSDDDQPTPDAGAKDGSTDGSAAWQCDKNHNGWEQCQNNRIVVCHGDIASPHFHNAEDCGGKSLTCMAGDEPGEAACVDSTKACAASDVRCDQNTAYFCIDGKLAVKACGTAKECHLHQGEAHCEKKSGECGGHGHVHGSECECDPGYKKDPANALNCIEEDFAEHSCELFKGTASTGTAVDTFSDFSQSHVSIDTPYAITLPDNKPSYVHFPVAEDGEYVIFVSEAGVLDTVMHRNETDVSPAPKNGGANAKCATDIKEHFEADLKKDDAQADKVPYILRFKAIAGGKTVTVMVRHNHGHSHP